MKIELKEFENQPMVKDGDFVVCRDGFQYLIGTDGDYLKLIAIDEDGCYILEDEYTLESLMEELDDLGLQRIVRSENLKLIEL